LKPGNAKGRSFLEDCGVSHDNGSLVKVTRLKTGDLERMSNNTF